MKPIYFIACASLAFGAVPPEEPNALAAVPQESKGAIHQTTRAIYPVRLLHEGVISGTVVLLLEADRHGTLIDVLPTAFTHRAFAEAAMTAAREWRYVPPRIGVEPVGLVAEVTFLFSVDGVLAIDRRGAQEPPEIPTFNAKYIYEAHGAHNLDAPPRPIDLPQPTYPEEWAEDGRTGRVTIMFYIDEAGHTRVPTVDAETVADDWLAAVALAAVRKWRFEPCTFRGRPVLVRAQQTFVFGKAAAAAAAAPRERGL